MALLERKLESLAPPVAEAAPDRAPDSLAAGVAQPLRGELEALLGPDRVLARAGDLVKYASDASPYRLFPQAVVMAHEAADVAKVLAYGRENGIPVTFRAGGTSLNGQGQSDGILVDVRRHFGGIAIEPGVPREGGAEVDAALARVKPGTVLGHANRVLAPHGRKLGPDPASTDIACVGGVIANNSGGMRCGVTKDSYSTVRSLTLVLPSGTTIDTAAPGAAEKFAAAEPELAAGLAEIREEILADEELAERIRRKFAIKNTTGYRLCAFLDAEEPLEIFRRLVVGSEGTLAFVAEAVFETVPLPARTTTAWVHFPDIDQAIDPVRELVEAGASAVELMVAPALITAAWNMVGAPEEWKELPPESAVLLVEFGAETDEGLDEYVARAGEIFASRETIRPVDFTREEEEIELAWRVREGLHGLIGKLRLPGTALIVEDVCVPPERIAEGARDLQALLGEHGFLPGVAGHASAGNLHFMLTPDFAKQEDLERYEAFMAGLVELIVDRYDGSLKAEHGTGINMAPYVEREWGEKATELMWRVKKLADPGGVLSPGVVLSRDSGAHLRNLKTTPADRGVGDGLRGVWVLRAGLSQPQPDDDAAAADRAAAGDGAPASRLAGAKGAAGGVRARGAGHLRRRRLLPARLPGRDRHRQVRQGNADRAPHRAGRKAGGGDREALGHGRGRHPSRPPPRPPRPPHPAAASRCPLQPPAPSLPPSTPAPPPSTSPPAPTASSEAHPGLWRRWWRFRSGRGCRSGFRRTSSALVVACPGALKGSARRIARRRTRWSSGSGAGAGRGRCRSSSTPPPAPRASPTPVPASSPRRTPSASASSRSSTRSPGPTTACCPGSRSVRRSARPRSTRPALPATSASPTASKPSPKPSPRTSSCRRRQPAAASPATAASPTPS